VQEVRAGSKKLVMVLICVPPSCSASVRQSRAAMAGMRAARLTRRQDAGNRFSAGQAPVAAAIVRADANRPVTGRTRRPLPPAPIAADLRADPGSWLAVDAAPERDDLRAATRVTDVGSYR
jgi:hypothetical protein